MMKLGWRDAAATVFVLLAAAVTVSVVNGWSWPLVGDARTGAIAVFVLGFAASVTGGGPQWFIAAVRRKVSTQGMWLSAFASAMGLLIVGLLCVDVFTGSVAVLVWSTVALLALWVVATIHHAIEARPRISLFEHRATAG